jgi:hypothetical protein
VRPGLLAAITIGFFIYVSAPSLGGDNPTNILAFANPVVANSRIEFSVTQPPLTDLAIERSADFSQWTELDFYQAASNAVSLPISNAIESTDTAAFYRAVGRSIYAPLSLAGLYVVFTNSEFQGGWYIGPDGALYEGFYREDYRFADYRQPGRTNNSWSVWVQYYGDSPAVVMELDFTSSDAGAFHYHYFNNAPAYVGNFLLMPPPVRIVTAPQRLTKITLQPDPMSVIGQFEYTAVLNGDSSGTFIVEQFLYYGLFTYQPSGTTAHLRLDYRGDYPGDFDDVTLDFDRLTFTGTQSVSSTQGQMHGTFTFLP